MWLRVCYIPSGTLFLCHVFYEGAVGWLSYGFCLEGFAFG
jgi:hypothetical protein